MKKGLKRAVAIASAVSLLGGTVGALAACKQPTENEDPDAPWIGKDVVVDPGNQNVGSVEESPFDKWDDPDSYTPEVSELPKTTGDPVLDYNTDVNKTASAKQGTYRTFTPQVPSLWNALDSVDNNDTQIMNYISSTFFEFDYKFDAAKGGKFNADGTVNTAAIIPGAYEVKFSAATKLEDVTDQVTGKLAYTDAQKAAGGYAWKLTLRDDLKWDDGTPIKAEDFVYSMQQQLNPEYRFRRASSYYGAVSIKGARDYAYQGQTVWSSAKDLFGVYDAAAVDDKMFFSLGNPSENKSDFGGAVCTVRTAIGFPDSYAAADVAAYIIGKGLQSTVDEILALQGKTLAQIKADPALKATWDACIGWWQSEPNVELDFFVAKKDYPVIGYDGNVGVYQDGDYGIVVCYTTSEAFLKEDGSLSYLAAYELGDLPLVKKSLFESCRIEPAEGQTLATNKYQTDLASSASWGPYKLTQYQSGKSYTLSKNDNWYGYNLKDNTNQYNVNAIKCDVMAETSTQWMAFLNGSVDEVGIDITHADDYRNSKYAKFTPGTYTFSWHMYGGLETLKQSGRNNTILAIDDFRKALSLAIDREAYAQANSTAYRGAYGYLNDMYYYDVENGGVYRQTDEAKSGLLRAYGYEESNGKWSLPNNPLIKDMTLDEAYETLSGYNLELAKEYVQKAYDRLTQYWVYYQYNSKKPIQIKFGTSTDNDTTRREYNYIRDNVLAPLFKDTPLEGKVELVFDASYGNDWDSKFLAGEYELCTSAWGSAAFNPHYFIGAYVDPANAYTASYWDTETVNMTMTVPGNEGDFPGAGKVRTMSIMNWYRCLNGYEHPQGEKYTYDWGVGKIPAEARNEILAKLEETVLTQYYSIPTITQNSATMLGAKFSYASDEYNTFLGYGGMRYLTVNHTDSEWTDYVASKGGNLEAEYKLSA